jgi:hypothetical protein
VIINLRGTSGAGKSTLARKIMDLYPTTTSNYAQKRGKRPISLVLSGAANTTPLFVLGHYEIVCGGGDTVTSLSRDVIFGWLKEARDLGSDVLFESLTLSDDYTRTYSLMKGFAGVVINLKTPIEICLQRVMARRVEAGNVKPFNADITRKRVKAISDACYRLKQSGIPVENLDIDAAFIHVRHLLRV